MKLEAININEKLSKFSEHWKPKIIAQWNAKNHDARNAGVGVREEARAEFSLYVTAGWRGRGIGKQLLAALIESSERHGIV